MGVYRTSYLLYGFKVTNKSKINFLNNHYEELMDTEPYSLMFNNNKSQQTIVFDWMSGKYIYVGIVLAKSKLYYGDDEFIEISKDEISVLKERLDSYMKDWPSYLVNLFETIEPKLYFFIHAH